MSLILKDLDLALLVYHVGHLADSSQEQIEESRIRLQDLGLLDELEDTQNGVHLIPSDRGEEHLEYLLSIALPERRVIKKD
jgi:hypothetical protein